MAPRIRILIVDDEAVTRDLLRMTLEQSYEVVEAHDGLDALDNINDIEPDFVIMDSMMPLMDGYQTTEAIRRNPQHQNIKVLFLSVLADKQAVKKGYAAGANMYLTKPFDPQRLKRNVDVFYENNPTEPRPKRYSLQALAKVRRQKIVQKAREALTAKARRERKPVQPTPVKQPRSVAPTPGPGTPARAPASHTPAPSMPTPIPTHTPVPTPIPEALRARIMVVDDDKEILDIARLALQPTFEVVTAEDGLEAIEKIVHCEPDIVVLDAMMPKLSGYQLCQSLRRNRRYQTAPIIFISVKASPKDREYARQLGANAFLPKPFDPDELERLVQNFVHALEFHVRPKKKTLAEIRVMEEERRYQRAIRETELTPHGDQTELQQFIHDELMHEED
jgi:twitching motility two-component system response regulator PilG